MVNDLNSVEALDKAYYIIAGIVRMHGERYLPIFKRLHEERETRQANRDLLLLAEKICLGPFESE